MTFLPLDRLLTEGRATGHPVALTGGAAVPFGRFQAEVSTAASALRGTGQAMLACDDVFAFAVGLFGLLHAGAGVLLPPNQRPGTLAAFAAEGVFVLDDAGVAGLGGPPERLEPPDPDRARIVFHTSGSTGAPKPVARTLGMLQREIEVFHAMWGRQLAHGPVFGTVPVQHLYGLSFRLLWPLAAGVPFDAATDAVWETLLPKLPGGAAVISSPAHLGRLGGIAPLAEAKRPGLVFSAGAPLPSAAAEAAAAILGCRPTEIFGSTETGAIATRRQRTGGEAWSPLPGVAIDCDGQGRMAVTTPYDRERIGTEDVIEPAGDGFHFIGRADRIVKVEGKRVSLPMIEAALEALPSVAAACVLALPGPPLKLGALLVLTDDGRTLRDATGRFGFTRMLRASLAAALEPAGLPRIWRFADVLPTLGLGKRDGAAIAALFAGPPS